ncbi:hypothetical protein [Haliangium sp.]|uniref:hypothetical protein n=1 Tax=Haliangium sp. TaxID=2663208 RepID=UPI003D0DF8AB
MPPLPPRQSAGDASAQAPAGNGDERSQPAASASDAPGAAEAAGPSGADEPADAKAEPADAGTAADAKAEGDAPETKAVGDADVEAHGGGHEGGRDPGEIGSEAPPAESAGTEAPAEDAVNEDPGPRDPTGGEAEPTVAAAETPAGAASAADTATPAPTTTPARKGLVSAPEPDEAAIATGTEAGSGGVPAPLATSASGAMVAAGSTELAPEQSGEMSSEGGFKPPELQPVPRVPEPGLLNEVRYALSFARARWQRRSAIKTLSADIEANQAVVDELLSALGRKAREHDLRETALAEAHEELDRAEARRGEVERNRSELRDRQAAAQKAHTELEAERQNQVDAVADALERAKQELSSLEAQRRSLRDKRKAIERQQKELTKAAANRDEQATKATSDDAKNGLLRAAHGFREEAVGLDPEREEMDHRLVALERPISQAEAKVANLESELDAARRALGEARESHRHRLAEIEAELSKNSRELSQAEAEIQRHLITLGTLVNLHRFPHPAFSDLYARIDQRRGAIGARSSEIDRLSAERDAYDRASLVRGFVALGVSTTAVLILVIVIVALL